MSRRRTHSTIVARTLTAVAILAFMAGCHTLRPVAVHPEKSDTIATELTDTPDAPRELSVITFTAIVDGASVNGQLRMATDSLMWVSVTKIIELGRAIATPDSVWVNVPLAGRYYRGTYADLSHRLKRPVTFQMLQDIATDDNAEQQIAELASQLGFTASVRITRRQKVERLTFPFAR